MTYTAAIDFGTCFSNAAVATPTGARTVDFGECGAVVSSDVFVHDDGTLAFGDEALRLGRTRPESLCTGLKRRIGDNQTLDVGGHQFSAERLTSHYLSWLVDQIARTEGGAPGRLIFTHPASWASRRIEALERTIAEAGLADAHITPEQLAVAVHHTTDFPMNTGELMAVYDLGGGIFDASVYHWDGKGLVATGRAAGEEHLGGIDFDHLFRHLVTIELKAEGVDVTDLVNSHEVLDVCRVAKEQLSTANEVTLQVLAEGEKRTVTVSRPQYEQLLWPSIAESLGSFRRALANADTDVNDLAAVLVTGGSSVMPLVYAMLTDLLPEHVQILNAEPRHAVAKGAAMLAAAPAHTVVASPRSAPLPLAAPTSHLEQRTTTTPSDDVASNGSSPPKRKALPLVGAPNSTRSAEVTISHPGPILDALKDERPEMTPPTTQPKVQKQNAAAPAGATSTGMVHETGSPAKQASATNTHLPVLVTSGLVILAFLVIAIVVLAT